MASRAPVAIQPRMLTREQAAAYCGLGVQAFMRECPVRPAAMGDDARLHRFDVKLLDVWLDGFGPAMATAGDDFWLAQMERAL